MRVTICTKRDIIANAALHRLLPKLSGMQVNILLANKRRKQVFEVPQLHMLRLLEKDLPNNVFLPLVRNDQNARFSTFEGISARTGIEILDVSDLGREKREDTLRSLRPDLILCLKFGFLLGGDVLRLPRLGTYNLHTGRLPDRPGLHAVFWAMHDGDEVATATVHRVDQGVDTGPIVAARDVPIAPGRSFFATMRDVYFTGADLLGDVALAAARGEAIALRPQEPSRDRRYVGLPTSGDIARLEEAGHPFLSPDDYLELATQFVAAR